MDIGDEVEVSLCLSATVVGRTFEAEPKVDLKTPWGFLNGVPVSILKSSQQHELLPANVTLITPAKRGAA